MSLRLSSWMGHPNSVGERRYENYGCATRPPYLYLESCIYLVVPAILEHHVRSGTQC